MAEQVRHWLQEHSEDICEEFTKQYYFSQGKINQKMINLMIKSLIS